MVKSLALRDRIISAAVGAAVASVIVPAEARAPASLGLAGQFNLFPYNTAYNRNSAQLGRFGATLRTATLSDAPVTQYAGRGSLGEMFGDRFLASASGYSRRSHASSRSLGAGLRSGGGRQVGGTVLTYGSAKNQFTPGSSSFVTSARLARRAGSGSVGVASDEADGGLYYTSASQAAAATALGTGRSASAGNALLWSSGTDRGGATGSGTDGNGGSVGGSRGGTTFTVSSAAGGGGMVSSAASSGSSFGTGGFGLSSSLSSGGSQSTTRTVTLGGLNGSVVTPGANSGSSAGSSVAGSVPGSNGTGTGGNTANNGGTFFPATIPVGAIAPSPVPEPGIIVTTLSLLGMMGFGLLRGRLRRA